jgi:hypothetical protein
MNKRLMTVVAGIAWAGVALSSAASANAVAVTTQTGGFAACSANSSPLNKAHCFDSYRKEMNFHTSYTQTIKLVGTACNAGGCQPDASTVYTDFIYPVGRKTAYDASLDYCDFGGTSHYYELSSCEC